MNLSPEDCQLFYKLHQALLYFVNEHLLLIRAPLAGPEEFAKRSPQERVRVRDALLEHMGLIDAFLAANGAELSSEECAIIASWHNLVAGQFYVYRYLKKHTIFLTANSPVLAYGVLALADPFQDIVGPVLPRLGNTVLLPFKDNIVYDGILAGYNVTFGPGIRRHLKESYDRAKASTGIITSLPPCHGRGQAGTPSSEPEVGRIGSQTLSPQVRWRLVMGGSVGPGLR